MEISFEKKEDYIHFKITGELYDSDDFHKMKDMCDITRQHGYSKILVDVRDFNYFLSTLKRFNISEYWVKISIESDYIKTAVLGDGEKMDKFTENVIVNRGGNFKLFTDEQDAINWLSGKLPN